MMDDQDRKEEIRDERERQALITLLREKFREEQAKENKFLFDNAPPGTFSHPKGGPKGVTRKGYNAPDLPDEDTPFRWT